MRSFLKNLWPGKSSKLPVEVRPVPHSTHNASPALVSVLAHFQKMAWRNCEEIRVIGAQEMAALDLGYLNGYDYRVTPTISALMYCNSLLIRIMDPHDYSDIASVRIPDMSIAPCVGRDTYQIRWFAPRRFNEMELVRPLMSYLEKNLPEGILPMGILTHADLTDAARRFRENTIYRAPTLETPEVYVSDVHCLVLMVAAHSGDHILRIEDRRNAASDRVVVMGELTLDPSYAVTNATVSRLKNAKVIQLLDNAERPATHRDSYFDGQTPVWAAVGQFLDKHPNVSHITFGTDWVYLELPAAYLAIRRDDQDRNSGAVPLTIHVYNRAKDILARIAFNSVLDKSSFDIVGGRISITDLADLFDKTLPVKVYNHMDGLGHSQNPVKDSEFDWPSVIDVAMLHHEVGRVLWDDSETWGYGRSHSGGNLVEVTAGHNPNKGPAFMVTVNVADNTVLDVNLPDQALAKIAMEHLTKIKEQGPKKLPMATVYQLFRQGAIWKKFAEGDTNRDFKFDGEYKDTRLTLVKPDLMDTSGVLAHLFVWHDDVAVVTGIVRDGERSIVTSAAETFSEDELATFLLTVAKLKESDVNAAEHNAAFHRLAQTVTYKQTMDGQYYTKRSMHGGNFTIQLEKVEKQGESFIRFDIITVQGTIVAHGDISHTGVIRSESINAGWGPINQAKVINEVIAINEQVEKLVAGAVQPLVPQPDQSEPLFIDPATGELKDEWVLWFAKTNNITLTAAVKQGILKLNDLMVKIGQHLNHLNGHNPL